MKLFQISKGFFIFRDRENKIYYKCENIEKINTEHIYLEFDLINKTQKTFTVSPNLLNNEVIKLNINIFDLLINIM